MRYCILSDIHANLEAFQAVLDSISNDRIDEYLSIGDVVGYGANPAESIELVRSLKPEVMISGNHEWGVVELLGLEHFNEYAAAAVMWTKDKLTEDEVDFLRSFRLVYECADYTLVHGSLESPEEFHYIFNKADANFTMQIMKTRVSFVGHSHVAGIFISFGDTIEYTKGPKIGIEPDKRYIVNSGSIGQPRDGDPRASFAIYDTGDLTIEIRRVAYDTKRAMKKILDAHLPSILGYRLLEGR